MRNLSLSLPGGYNIQTPGNLPGNTADSLIQWAVTVFMVLAVIVALFFLVYGGISFITSGGDKQKVMQARLKLTYAVVGLIIIFLSFFIINLVGQLFDINLLNVSVGECIGETCITR